ncbi:MAG: hypothetical protein GQ531_09245 [Sulfurovum sp.]|nr:hypothetical protein [Sulfurovum sp.]
MAFWVLMLILVLMFVVFFGFIVKKKPIKKLLLSYVGILVGYFLFVDFACGPNSHDVKIMKPQAKAIADYVVKNGVPKSLKNIPDLPYELVECKHKQKNLEICILYVNNREYKARIYVLGSVNINMYSKQTNTGFRYRLENNNSNNEWIIVENAISYSNKSSGICRTFRQ